MGTVGLSSGITNADLPTWVKLMLSHAESRNVGRPTRSPARASAAVSRHLEATQEVTMRVILR
jgi:hypothetical protein